MQYNTLKTVTEPTTYCTTRHVYGVFTAGTDATIAQHIETIKKRQYVELVGPAHMHFSPTPLGAALVKAYQVMRPPHRPWHLHLTS